jgi:hypothetical protein
MVIPFFMIWYFAAQVHISLPAGIKPEQVVAVVTAARSAVAAQDIKEMLDWAKTVLPPLIGFGSAIIAYYFGIRSGSSGKVSSSTSGE